MTPHDGRRPRPARAADPGTARPARWSLYPLDDPRRAAPKPIGTTNTGPGRPELVGLSVPDARHHAVVQGVTGAGKTTLLVRLALAEARAGRGLVVLDPQGDLVRLLLERLPADAAGRLLLIDPDESIAPPAYNVLDPGHDSGHGGDGDNGSGGSGRAPGVLAREWATDQLVGVFSQLYRGAWGPRMDDLLRGSALTLAARPGSTLADVAALLSQPGFRRRVLTAHGTPDGLLGLWGEFDRLSPPAQAQLAAPLLSRLRAVLSRRFARDLLAVPTTTVDLTRVLDGGILLARLPKGDLGGDVVRLVGSLLLAGVWAHTTRRAGRPPDERPDATVLVDEAQNFLHVPPGMDEVLAESRGYRVSWLLAHQHLAQLPTEVRAAIEANARNKLFLTVSADDARALARHVEPHFDAADLAGRAGFSLTARLVAGGQDRPPFTLDLLPLPDPVPGRAELLRAAARAHGLTHDQRTALARVHALTGPQLHDPDHHPADDVDDDAPDDAPGGEHDDAHNSSMGGRGALDPGPPLAPPSGPPLPPALREPDPTPDPLTPNSAAHSTRSRS